jgi:disulfide bond formation protein DsbB
MSTLTPLVNQILSTLTVIGQIIIISAIIFFGFIFKKKKNNIFFNYISNHSILFAFIVALTATSGSLFYSEIAGFDPCKLCWLQRIFMYPQVILLGIALKRKDMGVIYYSLALSMIGAIIAGYHYLLQIDIAPATPCSAIGSSASCSQVFVMNFGYVTIPMMSFTAFLLIIVFMIVRKIYNKYSIAA